MLSITLHWHLVHTIGRIKPKTVAHTISFYSLLQSNKQWKSYKCTGNQLLWTEKKKKYSSEALKMGSITQTLMYQCLLSEYGFYALQSISVSWWWTKQRSCIPFKSRTRLFWTQTLRNSRLEIVHMSTCKTMCFPAQRS